MRWYKLRKALRGTRTRGVCWGKVTIASVPSGYNVETLDERSYSRMSGLLVALWAIRASL